MDLQKLCAGFVSPKVVVTSDPFKTLDQLGVDPMKMAAQHLDLTIPPKRLYTSMKGIWNQLWEKIDNIPNLTDSQKLSEFLSVRQKISSLESSNWKIFVIRYFSWGWHHVETPGLLCTHVEAKLITNSLGQQPCRIELIISELLTIMEPIEKHNLDSTDEESWRRGLHSSRKDIRLCE